MEARKLYVRWRHRRMIRRAWPIAYLERGSLPRVMWQWRRETTGTYPSLRQAMQEFGRAVAVAFGKVS